MGNQISEETRKEKTRKDLVFKNVSVIYRNDLCKNSWIDCYFEIVDDDTKLKVNDLLLKSKLKRNQFVPSYLQKMPCDHSGKPLIIKTNNENTLISLINPLPYNRPSNVTMTFKYYNNGESDYHIFLTNEGDYFYSRQLRDHPCISHGDTQYTSNIDGCILLR